VPCERPFPDCTRETECQTLCKCQLGAASACADACGTQRPAYDGAFQRRVLELTNERRASGDCCAGGSCYPPAPALESSPLLAASANDHAFDMAAHSYFSHEDREGRTPLERMLAAGYDGCRLAENIARGHATPEAVVSAWMASADHCVNLLRSELRHLGVGYATSEDGWQHYWAQNFGG
jgi:uncharacterized protein YkwD